MHHPTLYIISFLVQYCNIKTSVSNKKSLYLYNAVISTVEIVYVVIDNAVLRDVVAYDCGCDIMWRLHLSIGTTNKYDAYLVNTHQLALAENRPVINIHE